MELKPGYKQTDLGVIPQDWKVSSVGAMGDVRAGKAFRVNPSDSYDQEEPTCFSLDFLVAVAISERRIYGWVGKGRMEVRRRRG